MSEINKTFNLPNEYGIEADLRSGHTSLESLLPKYQTIFQKSGEDHDLLEKGLYSLDNAITSRKACRKAKPIPRFIYKFLDWIKCTDVSHAQKLLKTTFAANKEWLKNYPIQLNNLHLGGYGLPSIGHVRSGKLSLDEAVSMYQDTFKMIESDKTRLLSGLKSLVAIKAEKELHRGEDDNVFHLVIDSLGLSSVSKAQKLLENYENKLLGLFAQDPENHADILKEICNRNGWNRTAYNLFRLHSASLMGKEASFRAVIEKNLESYESSAFFAEFDRLSKKAVHNFVDNPNHSSIREAFIQSLELNKSNIKLLNSQLEHLCDYCRKKNFTNKQVEDLLQSIPWGKLFASQSATSLFKLIRLEQPQTTWICVDIGKMDLMKGFDLKAIDPDPFYEGPFPVLDLEKYRHYVCFDFSKELFTKNLMQLLEAYEIANILQNGDALLAITKYVHELALRSPDELNKTCQSLVRFPSHAFRQFVESCSDRQLVSNLSTILMKGLYALKEITYSHHLPESEREFKDLYKISPVYTILERLLIIGRHSDAGPNLSFWKASPRQDIFHKVIPLFAPHATEVWINHQTKLREDYFFNLDSIETLGISSYNYPAIMQELPQTIKTLKLDLTNAYGVLPSRFTFPNELEHFELTSAKISELQLNHMLVDLPRSLKSLKVYNHPIGDSLLNIILSQHPQLEAISIFNPQDLRGRWGLHPKLKEICIYNCQDAKIFENLPNSQPLKVIVEGPACEYFLQKDFDGKIMRDSKNKTLWDVQKIEKFRSHHKNIKLYLAFDHIHKSSIYKSPSEMEAIPLGK